MKPIKKLLFSVCLIVFNLLLCLIQSHAESRFTEDNQFRYRIEDQEIIIEEYLGLSEYIIVPSVIEGMPVACIGENAFYGAHVTHVVLQEGIRRIEEMAFGESGLQRIDLPDTLEYIGDAAFADSLLKSVAIPDSVTELGFAPFGGATGLTTVSLSKSLRCLPERCFFENLSLNQIIIPEGIESIGDECFYFCNTLISIVLPSSLKTIGNDAFNGCHALTSIALPEGLLSIDDGCFAFCENLETVYVPSSLRIDENSIGEDYRFYGCPRLMLKIKDNPDLVRYAEQKNIPYN